MSIKDLKVPHLKISYSKIFQWLVLGMVGFFSQSCFEVEDYDFTKIKQIQWSPAYAVPLAFGSLGVHDLISEADSAYLKQYPDGLLYLEYKKNLETRIFSDLFSIPAVSLDRTYFAPVATTVPANQSYDLFNKEEFIDFGLSPEELVEILLKSGDLAYRINSNIAANMKIEIILPTFKKDGEVFHQIIHYTPRTGLPVSNVEGLNGYTIDLSTSTPAHNKFPVHFKVTILDNPDPVLVTTANYVSFELNLYGMDFKHIKGFFGMQTVDIPESTLGVTVFQNSFLNANVTLRDAKVAFEVLNEYDVPVHIDFETFEARNASGEYLGIIADPASPVAINSPVSLGGTAQTIISITNSDELVGLEPDQFYYKASATMNPTQASGNNFLSDTSKMNLNLLVEVPLYGTADGLILEDTLEISLEDDSREIDVEKAFLKVKITNEMPIEANVQIYILDENGEVVAALFTPQQSAIIKSSMLDASGNMVSAGVYDELIEIDKTKIEHLLNANKIYVVATMNTTKDSKGTLMDVKFKSQYRLTVDLGLQAHLNVNVKP